MPGRHCLKWPERTAPRRWGEEPAYTEVCNQGPVVWAVEDYRSLKKTRYPKLKSLALLCVWEDTRVWAHRNHCFRTPLSYLGPASCDLIFHVLSSSVLITGSGSHLIAATSQVFLFFCFFPVTQIVKNPPAMWETWVRPLGWEDPLEKEMANHSSILAWREFHGLRSLAGYSP